MLRSKRALILGAILIVAACDDTTAPVGAGLPPPPDPPPVGGSNGAGGGMVPDRPCEPACPAGDLCEDGVCRARTCETPNDCAGGQTCEDGVCTSVGPRACTTDSQCRGGEICFEMECAPIEGVCLMDADCDEGRICLDRRCVDDVDRVCMSDLECRGGEVCLDMMCVSSSIQCLRTEHCGEGEMCVEGQCVADTPVCVADDDCEGRDRCVEGECVPFVCGGDADCAFEERCLAGRCEPRAACTSDGECDPGLICLDGLCHAPQCSVVEHCPPDNTCELGRCIPPPENCNVDAECLTGQVCIDTRCRDCVDDNECAVHPDGNRCVEGRCTICESDEECADHPSGDLCTDGNCTPCLISPETCNGLDEDCDDVADEGLGVGEACQAGHGICQAEGVLVCAEDGGTICDAVLGEPGEETCNDLDDDCDSVTDEGYGIGEPCEVGVGQCRRESIFSCGADGEAFCDADPGDPRAEGCNGSDDDCDGLIDENLGLGELCEVGVGACLREGIQVCTGELGVSCSVFPGPPGDEVCNGIDDDCDGTTDEGLGLGDACTSGVGECVRAGVLVCGENGATTCDAVPGDPVAERCDNLDQDCDGAVDEDTGLGDACTVGVGQCARPGVYACADDGGLDCVGEQGEPSEETCDGTDQDCDGTADEGLGLGDQCALGVGGCRRLGELVCDHLGGTQCNAVRGEPTAEVCNFEDDDCDGSTDETFVLGIECEAGVGACYRQGSIRCAADGGTECDVVAGDPVAEQCNGADDDCDETVDENVGVRGPCIVGRGICAREGIEICDADGEIICTATSGDPAVETCNGGDDDCDGLADEDLGVGDACFEGVGACRTQGVQACADDGGIQCVVNVGLPTSESCNDVDDDCDGVADEDFGVGEVCTNGFGICAREGTRLCDENGRGICDAVPGEPGDELCNGIDEDCDGRADEDFGVGEVCGAGIGGCRREGEQYCETAFGVLCDAVAGEPQIEQCNRIDDDCDGTVDEDLPDDTCGDGRQCINGYCAGTPRPGNVVISEVMYDTEGILNEGSAEWIELHNPTAEAYLLTGCQLMDLRTPSLLGAVLVPPGGYVFFAHSANPVINGGLEPQGTFTASLNNSGDRVSLLCRPDGDVVEIDRMNYDTSNYPRARAASLSLSVDLMDATANNDPNSWCLGTDVYFEDPEHRGSPGLPNPVCERCDPNPCNSPPLPACDGDTVLAYPPQGNCDSIQGSAVCSYVPMRMPCDEGLVCIDGACVEEPPECTENAQCDPGLSCADETCVELPPECDSDGECNISQWCRLGVCIRPPACLPNLQVDIALDELVEGTTQGAPGGNSASCGRSTDGPEVVHRFLAPDAGRFCFSTEGSAIDTVVYIRTTCGNAITEVSCNDDFGPGNLASEADLVATSGAEYFVFVDGPQRGDYQLTVTRGPCPECHGDAECDGGRECVEGRCMAGPTVGQVIVSEFLYQPTLNEAEAEWLELYNTTDEPLYLDNCELADQSRAVAPLDPLIIEPRGRLLLTRNLDPNRNGGLVADGVLGIQLNNGGDHIIIYCDSQEIDRVEYARGQRGFPDDARARSVSLSETLLDADSNNRGDSYCPGVNAYFNDPPHYGSPGGPNIVCNPCVPNPCQEPPVAVCEGNVVVETLGPGICSDLNGEAQCEFQFQRTPCAEGLMCEGGACIEPWCQQTGCPDGQVCNAETRQCEDAPAACPAEGCPEGQICDQAAGECVDAPNNCQVSGCPAGQRCDEDTGECLVPPGCQQTGCAAAQLCNQDTGECEDAPAGSCEVPVVLDGFVSVNGRTQGVGRINDASCGAGGSGPEMVYSFSVAEDIGVCVHTAGSAFDTVVSVRTECADVASEVGCNDDDELVGGGTQSAVTIAAEADVVYSIIVDGRGGANGDYSLSILPGACESLGLAGQPCENADGCADGNTCYRAVCVAECEVDEDCTPGLGCYDEMCLAENPAAACEADYLVELPGVGVYEGNTANNPTGQGASCAETDDSPEVMHRVVFDEAAQFCVSSTGSSFDTVVEVRRQNCVGGAVAACADDVDPETDLTSEMEFNAEAGVPYFILVDGLDTAVQRQGAYQLRITEGRCADAPPACVLRGDCPGSCEAPTLVDQFGVYNGSTDGAPETIDSASCGPSTGEEAVYQLNLGYDGTACVGTMASGSAQDTVLTIQSQCGAQASEYACNDDRDLADVRSEIELEMDSANTYFVVVDGGPGSGGEHTLNITAGPCPECHFDRHCPANQMCDAGACVQCRSDDDCRGEFVCDAGLCQNPPCETDADCVVGRICTLDRCVEGFRPPPSCDAEAVVNLGGLGQYQGTTAGATVESDAGCAETGASPEVAHSLVFDENRTICVNTRGSGFDTVAYMRSNCGDESTEVVCSNDIAEGRNANSAFTVNVRAGLEYFVFVDGLDGAIGGSQGDYILEVSDGPCPQCVENADCGENQACQGGTCFDLPDCVVDADCEGEETCDGGFCVAPPQPCEFDNQCPGEMICENLVCITPGACAEAAPYQIGSVARGTTEGANDAHNYAGTCGGRVRTSPEDVYSFAAGADGYVCLSTVGSSFDTVMYVRQNDCAAGPEVDGSACGRNVNGPSCCNDDENFGLGRPGNSQSALEVQVTAGTVYYVFVDGYAEDRSGNYELSSSYGRCGDLPPVQCVSDSDCDYGEMCTELQQCVAPIGTCFEPVELSGPGQLTVRTTGAPNTGRGSCAGGVEGGDARSGGESIYRLRVAQNTEFCVDTFGSNYDTVLHVRRASCNDERAQISCNDDFDEAVAQSRLSFIAEANTSYYIFADAYSRTGNLVLNVTEGPCR